MAFALTMTAGDDRYFVAVFTLSGRAYDLTGCGLTFTATDGAGHTITHSLNDGHVTVPNDALGNAVLYVAAGDTSGWSTVIALNGRWVLVDAGGHTITAEEGTLTVSP